jgi:Yip1 domain
MNNLIQRVIGIISAPKTEWPKIATETATPASLYMPYVLILAAIGPLAYFFGGGSFGFFRLSSGFMLKAALWQYVMSLIGVAVLALVINVLAPTFGGTKDTNQSFKTAAYAMTAAWLGGIGSLLGFGLGGLLALAGGIYSIYLLYTALPHTMKAPAEKTVGYTVVIILVGIVAGILLFALGRGLGLAGGLAGVGASMGSNTQVLDPDSALGRIEQMGRQLEQAEKSGKPVDPSAAVGTVLGALTGASGEGFEALPADTLKALLPETVAGLSRQSIEAQRSGMFGFQVATAEARYGSDSSRLKLELIDTGGGAGMMALAGWANIEQSSEEGTRTERTGKQGDRMVHEQWDSATNEGEYAVVLGNRFVAKVEGNAANLDALKSALGSVDLAKLEAMKGQGKKVAQ